MVICHDACKMPQSSRQITSRCSLNITKLCNLALYYFYMLFAFTCLVGHEVLFKVPCVRLSGGVGRIARCCALLPAPAPPPGASHISCLRPLLPLLSLSAQKVLNQFIFPRPSPTALLSRPPRWGSPSGAGWRPPPLLQCFALAIGVTDSETEALL